MEEENRLNQHFAWNDRLGIHVPSLKQDWEQLSRSEQEAVLARWELVRGSIPERIKQLETVINRKQEKLSKEDDFAKSCRLNGEIAELASCINDLQIWFRVQQDLDEAVKRHG